VPKLIKYRLNCYDHFLDNAPHLKNDRKKVIELSAKKFLKF